MLRFKQFILEYFTLLENRIDFLKNQFAGKLDTSHDPYGVHKDHENIIDHFATHADPTKNKAHTQWILKQYQQKKIRQEDHPRIKETLANFERYKSKLPNRDINGYNKLSEIESAVRPYLETEEPVSKRQETKKIKTEGADLIHSENGFEVRHLKTRKAACEYGKGTKWCTAATGGHNAFDGYNEDGPLYFIKGRNENGDIRKYQYHPASEQLMDEEDDPVDMSTFVERNPEMRNVKHFAGYHYSLPLKPEHKKELSDELHKLIDNKDLLLDDRDEKISKAVEDAHKRGYLDDSHLDKITSDNSLYNTHHELAYNANYYNLHLKPNHIRNLTSSENSTDAHNLLVSMHGKYGNVLSDEDVNNIVNNPKATQAHHQLVSQHSYAHDPNSNNHVTLSPEQLTTIANHPNSFSAHNAMIVHSLANSDHINSILNNKQSTEAHRTMLNQHLDPEVSSGLNDDQFSKLIQNFGEKRGSLTRWDNEKILNAHNKGIIKLSDEHINHIINGSNTGALQDILVKSMNNESPLSMDHGKIATQRLMGIRPPLN